MNTKMKVLSLALVGLAGFAGSAMAACPPGPAVADGGAWSSKATLGGGTLAITAGGLDGSECKLDAALGTTLSSQATVQDDSPAGETRYRFQFLVNPDAFGAFGNQDSVLLFSGNAASPYPATGGRRPIVTVALSAAGSGAKRLTIIAACENAATNYRCVTTTPNLVAGMNRIELDVPVSSSGTLKYWLNAAAGTAEPAETGKIEALNNVNWVGVESATLGLVSPSPAFRTAHAAQVANFDAFDSRRQTYIGH